MIHEKLEEIKWFVEFSQLEFDQLAPGDRAKLIIESPKYLFYDVEWFEEVRQFAESTQNLRLLAVIEKAQFVHENRRLPEDLYQPKYWQDMIEIQAVVKEVLGNSISDGKIKNTGSLSAVFYFLTTNHNNQHSLVVLPMHKGVEEQVRMKLLILLHGLPVSTICKCEGCGKYFVNETLRKKKFCSPRCMWKLNAEKIRKADPEKYKAKMKKAMLKHYENKLEKVHGPKAAEKLRAKRQERIKED